MGPACAIRRARVRAGIGIGGGGGGGGAVVVVVVVEGVGHGGVGEEEEEEWDGQQRQQAVAEQYLSYDRMLLIWYGGVTEEVDTTAITSAGNIITKCSIAYT